MKKQLINLAIIFAAMSSSITSCVSVAATAIPTATLSAKIPHGYSNGSSIKCGEYTYTLNRYYEPAMNFEPAPHDLSCRSGGGAEFTYNRAEGERPDIITVLEEPYEGQPASPITVYDDTGAHWGCGGSNYWYRCWHEKTNAWYSVEIGHTENLIIKSMPQGWRDKLESIQVFTDEAAKTDQGKPSKPLEFQYRVKENTEFQCETLTTPYAPNRYQEANKITIYHAGKTLTSMLKDDKILISDLLGEEATIDPGHFADLRRGTPPNHDPFDPSFGYLWNDILIIRNCDGRQFFSWVYILP